MVLLNCLMIIIGRGLTSVECIWNLWRRYRGASWPSSYDSLWRYKHKVRDDLFACFLYICVAVSCDLLETRRLSNSCIPVLITLSTYSLVYHNVWKCWSSLQTSMSYHICPKSQNSVLQVSWRNLDIFSFFYLYKEFIPKTFFQHSVRITKNQD